MFFSAVWQNQPDTTTSEPDIAVFINCHPGKSNVSATLQILQAVFGANVLIFIGFLLVLGTYWIYKRIEPVYWATVLGRSTPTSVREASDTQGVTELEGRAVPTGAPAESPFTGTVCLAYEVEIEQYERGVTSASSKWKTIFRDRDAVPFRFEDDTGSVAVDPATVSLLSGSEDTIEVDGSSTAGEPIASYLRKINLEPGEGSTGTLGILPTGDERRYSEKRLAPDEEVHVYGPIESGIPVPTGRGEFNIPVPSGSGSRLFLISDSSRWATISGLLRAGLKGIAGVVMVSYSVTWVVLAIL